MTTQRRTTRPDPCRLYRARLRPELVEVPEQTFLMIDGHGDPNTSVRFPAAIQALFSVGYTLRFALKRAGAPAYRVGPLEGLWWGPDMARFSAEDKSDWSWTIMIHVPDEVTGEDVERAVRDVTAKKDVPAALDLRLERLAEGRCAQVMHRGPFSAEAETIATLHAFIADQGLSRRGKHHEIYLSDTRRAAPENWRTVLRQPVAP